MIILFVEWDRFLILSISYPLIPEFVLKKRIFSNVWMLLIYSDHSPYLI